MTELVRPVPPYIQIADAIQADIANGKLKDGDRVPSARQIVADWDVAVATASRVQAELRARGLVAAIKGVGTVVRVMPAGHSGQERAQLSLRRGTVNDGQGSRIVSVGLVSAPADVALSLGIDEGQEVVRRERITTDADGAPVEHSVTWIPGRYAALAPEIAQPERVPGGTFMRALQADGKKLGKGTEEATAICPSPEVADALGIKESDPVTLTRYWFRDLDDVVVEYGEAVRPSGRWARHNWTVDVS